MLLFHGLGVMNISISSSLLTYKTVKSPNQAIRCHQNLRDASGICVLLLALTAEENEYVRSATTCLSCISLSTSSSRRGKIRVKDREDLLSFPRQTSWTLTGTKMQMQTVFLQSQLNLETEI